MADPPGGERGIGSTGGLEVSLDPGATQVEKKPRRLERLAVDDSGPAVVVVETRVGVVGVIGERKAAQERTLAHIARNPLGAAVGEEDQHRAAE